MRGGRSSKKRCQLGGTKVCRLRKGSDGAFLLGRFFFLFFFSFLIWYFILFFFILMDISTFVSHLLLHNIFFLLFVSFLLY